MMGCLVPRRECSCQAEKRAKEKSTKEKLTKEHLAKEQLAKEQAALLPGVSSRPADVLLPNFAGGRHLALDVMV